MGSETCWRLLASWALLTIHLAQVSHHFHFADNVHSIRLLSVSVLFLFCFVSEEKSQQKRDQIG